MKESTDRQLITYTPHDTHYTMKEAPPPPPPPPPRRLTISRQTLPLSGKDVIIVTLHRPDRFNSFNKQQCHDLARTFADLRQTIANNNKPSTETTKPVAAVILTGQGPHFCAGVDLTDPPNPLQQSSDLLSDLYHNPVHQMQLLQVPLLAALKGHVITGGFELALACDVLIGNATTKFRDTHVKFGLAPCWGLSQRLQLRIGPGRAKLVSLGAIAVAAEQAYEWGLLDILVPNDADPLQRALELADEIGVNDGEMVQKYKQAMVQGGLVTLEQGLKRERALGLAHYVQVMQDGTLDKAKEFINDEGRPRSKL